MMILGTKRYLALLALGNKSLLHSLTQFSEKTCRHRSPTAIADPPVPGIAKAATLTSKALALVQFLHDCPSSRKAHRAPSQSSNRRRDGGRLRRNHLRPNVFRVAARRRRSGIAYSHSRSRRPDCALWISSSGRKTS